MERIDGEISADTKPKRAKLACIFCSKRKKKCSGSEPCSLCARLGQECSYSKVVKKRGPVLGSVQKKRKPKVTPGNASIAVSSQTVVTTAVSCQPNTDGKEDDSFIEVSSVSTLAMNLPLLPEQWTYWTFFSYRIVDSKGKIRDLLTRIGRVNSLLDFYGNEMYTMIPILDLAWMADHFADVPLHTWHAILALSSVYQNTADTSFTESHARHAFQIIHQDLEKGDPMTVVTLLHLTALDVLLRKLDQATAHFCQAVDLATYLGFNSGGRVFWKSPIRSILGKTKATGPLFIAKIVVYIYLVDTHCHVATGTSLKVTETLNREILLLIPQIAQYERSDIIHFLSYAIFLVPQSSIIRRLARIDSSNWKKRLEVLDDWDLARQQIPRRLDPLSNPTLQDKLALYLDATCHWNRLSILKSAIKESLQGNAVDRIDKLRSLCKESCLALSEIALRFLRSSYIFPTDYFLGPSLWLAGLLHVALRSENAADYIKIHCTARLRLFSYEDELNYMLKECAAAPGMVVGML
ncbi:hypothetical protein HDV03_003870 [Kappamyces sp. JEL0829]|nr:hypothetical protein HDV03_003870 [Kappamyces sp. JEL0829]